MDSNKNKIVQEWWKQTDDINEKKRRREQHRKENANFNKQNRVSMGKGDKKRFYTQPTMSWNDLITEIDCDVYMIATGFMFIELMLYLFTNNWIALEEDTIHEKSK